MPILLGSEKPGEPTLVGTKPDDLTGVVPTDYGPSALNPIFERTQIYDDLSLGMGQRIQEASRTRGYRYLIGADLRYASAIGWDLTTARQFCKGPEITLTTPATSDAVNGITQIFEWGSNIYALSGRYCLVRVNDASWTVLKDFGVGKKALQALVYASNALSATFVYVAMGDTEPIWRYDGATWVQSVEALFARCWTIIGRDIWRAAASTANTVVKCSTDADPWVLANWTNGLAYTIGDKLTAIQSLIGTTAQILLILKTDGVYTLDTLGNDHPLYPGLRGSNDADNGKFATLWLNDVYISMRDGGFRIHSSDFSIEEIGTERLTDNATAVRGRLTAMCGHDTFGLYAGLYNDDTGNSFLMKFGGWQSQQDAPAVRVDAWHGSLSQQFNGLKITAMYRAATGNGGAAAGHSRMFFALSDPSGVAPPQIACFTLSCTPNPIACSAYRFTTLDATLDFPLATMGFPSDMKAIKGFSVAGTTLNANSYAQVSYAQLPNAPQFLLTNPDGTTVNFNTLPYQRANAPSGANARYLQWRLIGKSVANTESPVITFVDVHYAVRPPLQLVWSFLVLADDNLIKRDGSMYRLAGKTVRDELMAFANQAVTRVVMPDETVQQLMFSGYVETMAFYARTRRWHSAVKLTGAQYIAPVTDPGGSYRALARYTYRQLAQYTYTQLTQLL